MDYFKEMYRSEIESAGKIQEEGIIVCPHCFYEENLDGGIFKERSLAEEERKCAACEKTFNVEMFVCKTYYATTKRRKNGKK